MKNKNLELVIIIRNKLREIFPPEKIIRKTGKIIYRFSKNIYHIIRLFKEKDHNIIEKLVLVLPKFISTPKIYRNNWFDYQLWIKLNETKESEITNQALGKITDSKHILISIVVPVYQSNIDYLEQMIRSVQNQTYSNWELCIANGSPENKRIRSVLDHFESTDPRIHTINIEKNLGISGNTNIAIELANGEYIAFLDHDDTLAPFAIFEVIKALQKYPKTDLIYSDEDKIDPKNHSRFGPFFKPSFSINYLRSINYICHLLVIRKEIGDAVGWLREGFEGSQDFDLILRTVEKSRFITHIPKVLYHWRAHKNSTAYLISTKDYAHKSGEKAIQAHLQRIGLKGKVKQAKIPTTYRITYELSSNPKVSIIIPNHDQAEYLHRCINSILSKTSYRNYEIIIVENNSREQKTFDLYEKLHENPLIRIEEFNEQPFNFSKINNQAIRVSKGEIILFLNNDTEVISLDWIERMLEHAIRPEVGVVGALLLYPDNTIQHAGVIVGTRGYAGHAHCKLPENSSGYFGNTILPHNLSAVTGACLMMPKDLFLEIGGFNENYRLACSDIDLCLKVRKKGKLIVWTPYARLYHFESQTRGYDYENVEKKARLTKEINLFRRNWREFLDEGDPYYNPNLTQKDVDYSINLNKIYQKPRAMCN